jgi:hypothetical protein
VSKPQAFAGKLRHGDSITIRCTHAASAQPNEPPARWDVLVGHSIPRRQRRRLLLLLLLRAAADDGVLDPARGCAKDGHASADTTSASHRHRELSVDVPHADRLDLPWYRAMAGPAPLSVSSLRGVIISASSYHMRMRSTIIKKYLHGGSAAARAPGARRCRTAAPPGR